MTRRNAERYARLMATAAGDPTAKRTKSAVTKLVEGGWWPNEPTAIRAAQAEAERNAPWGLAAYVHDGAHTLLEVVDLHGNRSVVAQVDGFGPPSNTIPNDWLHLAGTCTAKLGGDQ